MSKTTWPPDFVKTMPAEAATDVGADDDKVDTTLPEGFSIAFLAVAVAIFVGLALAHFIAGMQ